jgi:hypothetical protein
LEQPISNQDNTMELGFDLVHYLRQQKLPKSRCLLPLFEAVVNAFHAIRHAERTDGSIEILCKRDRKQQTIDEDGEPIGESPFSAFVVRDNGVGFNDTEYQAFRKFSTDRKLELGGKGQGRFTWLMAFQHAEVESTFRDDGEFKERTFRFIPENDPIPENQPKPVQSADTGTTIRLINYKLPFRDLCPKTISPIARQLADHCFELLFERKAPRVTIAECDAMDNPISDSVVCLNDLLASETILQKVTKPFQIKQTRFKITHLLRASSDGNHEIHLCANGLPTTSWKLQKVLPIAKGKLEQSDGTACTYTSYVSSKLLDDAADNLRTRFDLASDDDGELLNEITEAAIVKKSGELASAFLVLK